MVPATERVLKAVRQYRHAKGESRGNLLKIPKRLEALVHEGMIDGVVRQLMSGKEAAVYIVRCGQHQGHRRARLDWSHLAGDPVESPEPDHKRHR